MNQSNSMSTKLEALNTRLLDYARQAGAIHADALIVTDIGESVSVRMGKIESVEREDSQGAGLRAFVESTGGLAFASASTSDLSDEGLRKLAEQTIAMARISEPDPDAVPPVGAMHPDAQALDDWRRKHPYKTHGWDTETAKEAALACEQAALSYDKAISNSDGAQASFGESCITYASSDGFVASFPNVSASLSVSVIAGSDEDMQTDYAYDQARVAATLRSADAIGREAAERTAKRLGASAYQGSKSCPIVFEPRVAKSLIGHLLSAINGRAVLQQRSFLADSLGKKIFPEFIHLVDDPDHPQGLGNRLFDGEGTACKACDIIAAGELKLFLTDRYAAGRLQQPSSGHARRGLTGDIGIGSSNVILQPGTDTPEAILQDIQSGILITELMGFGVNGVNGDYSRGAAGFLIENGVITSPVQEFTIAGNLLNMFANISHLGSDLTWFASTAVPTICVQGMTVAGQAE